MRTKTSGCLGYDRCRIGIVQHPAFWRIFFHVVNIFQNACNRAHSVCDTSRTACFLAYHTVFQRNLFVQFTHWQLTYTNMRQTEINICISCLWISSGDKFNIRILFLYNNFTCLSQFILTNFIIIIELNAAKW